jgi:hypothetical protein
LSFDLAQDPETFIRAVRVTYANEYPVMNWMKETMPQVSEALLRKLDEWTYEEERRIVIPGGAHSYQQFRPEALTGVVFGCRASAATRTGVAEIIVERAKLGLPTVRQYEAVKHESKYAVVLRRVPTMLSASTRSRRPPRP